MTTQIKYSKISAALLAMGLLSISNSALADVPNTFTAGSAVIADDINENFTDLDTRVTDLETIDFSGLEDRVSDLEIVPVAEVSVDCGADPNALASISFASKTTYVLTGMCNGPISDVANGVTIKGDDTGDKDDGIILPLGLIDNPYAALGIYGIKTVNLENMTISADNYTDNVNGFSVAALNVGNKAYVRVYDVNFVGGRKGIDAFRNSFIRLYANVEVSNFGRTGINSSSQSTVEIREFITVSGKQTSVETRGYGLRAGDNGSIKIKKGGIIISPLGTSMTNPSKDQRAIMAWNTSSVNARKGSGASFDLTGRLFSAGGSTIEIEGVNVNGDIKSSSSSHILIKDSIAQQDVQVEQSASMELTNTTITGRLKVRRASAAYIAEGTIINDGIDVDRGSAADIYDSTISGRLEINQGGSININDSDVSGGYQHAHMGGTIRYFNTDISLTEVGENLWANDGGRILLEGSTTVSTIEPIHAGISSTLYLNGGDLGAAVIECFTGIRANQVFENGATNYTFDAGCN